MQPGPEIHFCSVSDISLSQLGVAEGARGGAGSTKGFRSTVQNSSALMSRSAQQSSQWRASVETRTQHLQTATSPHTVHSALPDVGTAVPIQTHTACKPAEPHLATGLQERPLVLKLQLLKLLRACAHSDPLLPFPSSFRTLVLALKAQYGTGPTPKQRCSSQSEILTLGSKEVEQSPWLAHKSVTTSLPKSG